MKAGRCADYHALALPHYRRDGLWNALKLGLLQELRFSSALRCLPRRLLPPGPSGAAPGEPQESEP